MDEAAPKLTATCNSEYKEAFALFDKKGTGAVQREVLGDLLRALGQNPTQAEVAEIIAGAPREGALNACDATVCMLTLITAAFYAHFRLLYDMSPYDVRSVSQWTTRHSSRS